MRIGVTGASGFIGSHLCTALEANGHDVVKLEWHGVYHGRFDKIYHLMSPATTPAITRDPCDTIDTIINGTIWARNIDSKALFINISSMGAGRLHDNNTPQNVYNTAKKLSEMYIKYHGGPFKNYRLPAVYGPGMKDEFYIKRCVDGTATEPTGDTASKKYIIAYIDDVINMLVNGKKFDYEKTTIGKIYEDFSNGSRGLHR